MRTKKLFGKVISILLSGTMLAGTASAEYPVISTDDNSGGTLYLAETAVAVSEAWDGTIASEYAGGDGSESAPYLIANGQQLAFLSQQVDSKVDYTGVFFKLTADIVLNVDVDDDPIAWNSIGEIEPVDNVPVCFNGTFDGDNHKIVGMYQNNSDQHGLFAWIGENGTVKNVGVTDGRIVTSVGYIGNIAGKNYGTIINCCNAIRITSSSNEDYYGGICGYNVGLIENCTNKAELYLTGGTSSDDYIMYIAGICGYNGGTINGCSNTGKIHTTTNYVKYLGGVCGYNNSGTISYSFNDSAVRGRLSTSGVCGYSDAGTIKDCYNTGTVDGDINVGGVCGRFCDGSINDCHNDGNVKGFTYVGGICGVKDTSNIKDCYNTGAISSSYSYCGGICGSSTSSTNTDVILRCYNTGGVYNSNSPSSSLSHSGSIVGYTGGICGNFSGYLIKQCYNTGTVGNNNFYTGGICGYLSKGEVKECFNQNTIYACGNYNYDARYIGGIIGYVNANSVIENCYNTGKISAERYVYNFGGLWGYSSESLTNAMKNCYNAGDITYKSNTSGIYPVGPKVGQISNVYYDCEVCTGSYTTQTEWAKTTDELTSETAISDLGFDTAKWSKKTNSAVYKYYPNLTNIADDDPVHFAGAPVPTGLTAVAGNGSVTLSWDAMEDAESYSVYLHANDTVTELASGLTETAYTATGLTNDVEVGFTIKSYVNSTLSNACSVVYATPVDVSAPINVKAIPGIGEVQISWTAVEGATKYAVYYSTDDSEYILASDTVTDTSYTVTGLNGGQKYYFKVMTYGADAWSDFSDVVSTDIAYFGVSAHSLLLGDDIGVKYYIEFSDDVLSDSTSVIKLTVNGRETTAAVSEAAHTDNLYEFICPVAAAEMNDTITGRLYVGGQATGDSFTYSVKTYADYILANSEKYADEVPLVEAMLNYGAAAEKYFRGSTEMSFTKPATTAEELAAYKYVVTDSDKAYDFVGQVITLNSKVTAKLYFSGKDFSVSDFAVKQNGISVDASRLSVSTDDIGTYLAISGISANEMGESFTIIIGGVTVSNYSVFSYVQEAINSSIDGLPDVVSALYVYGCAAEIYSKL